MSGSYRETVEDGVESAFRGLSGAAHAGAEKVEAGAQRAEDALDEGTGRVREGIRRTRTSLESAGRRVGGAASDSIDYLRENGMRGVMREMEDVVRKYPGRTVLAVVAVGFLIGRSLRQRD
jgi:ElaB/YqjD/DUF883 family membrane-anchored ribosome-binding protein